VVLATASVYRSPPISMPGRSQVNCGGHVSAMHVHQGCQRHKALRSLTGNRCQWTHYCHPLDSQSAGHLLQRTQEVVVMACFPLYTSSVSGEISPISRRLDRIAYHSLQCQLRSLRYRAASTKPAVGRSVVYRETWLVLRIQISQYFAESSGCPHIWASQMGDQDGYCWT